MLCVPARRVTAVLGMTERVVGTALLGATDGGIGTAWRGVTERVIGTALPGVTERVIGTALPGVTERVSGIALPGVTERVVGIALPGVTDGVFGTALLLGMTDGVIGTALPGVTDGVISADVAQVPDLVIGALSALAAGVGPAIDTGVADVSQHLIGPVLGDGTRDGGQEQRSRTCTQHECHCRVTGQRLHLVGLGRVHRLRFPRVKLPRSLR